MNNYEYLLNNYNDRAFATNTFNPFDPFNMAIQPNINMNNNNNFNFYTPKEALDKGNLFANLYTPYKNYKPVTLTGKNEQERMYLEYARMAFAAHELNLYLDNYPDNESILQLFNDYRKKANELRKEYEQKYGPLTVSADMNNMTPFAWENLKWPWEGGK